MKMRILSRSDIMKAVDLDKIMETVEMCTNSEHRKRP